MSDVGQRLIAAVREIAAENPDFVYDDDPYGCVYFDGKGAPSCIMGHACSRLGLLVGEPNDVDGDTNISAVAKDLQWGLDRDELDWLEHVQRSQDRRTPWGECVS